MARVSNSNVMSGDFMVLSIADSRAKGCEDVIVGHSSVYTKIPSAWLGEWVSPG